MARKSRKHKRLLALSPSPQHQQQERIMRRKGRKARR